MSTVCREPLHHHLSSAAPCADPHSRPCQGGLVWGEMSHLLSTCCMLGTEPVVLQMSLLFFITIAL